MPGDRILDVAGVGFGPSNLALAIAIEEHNRATSGTRIAAVFVEKQQRFGWHRGMLIPGATMQISFLKDLVTQRDARSEFTFLHYLSERQRLTHFINLQTFFPTRLEFHDYLEWAASKITVPVEYGKEVRDIAWREDHFEIDVSNGAPVLARNVVLAGGIVGRLPDGVVTGPRIFHNHNLLGHLDELPTTSHRRFVVVGAGQSAAEVTGYLHATYPDCEVHAVFGKYGYTPADDSPYANRIFDPDAVDEFHQASDELRSQLLAYHRSTNYSAVDLELIEELYRREYGERVAGRRRLFVRGASEIVSADQSADDVTVTVKHRTSGDLETLRCDAVVYATGFRPQTVADVGLSLAPFCLSDEQDRPSIVDDYRLETTDEITGHVYVQGDTEHTHGLTSTLLSNLAVRSGQIVASLARADRDFPVGDGERSPRTAHRGVIPADTRDVISQNS